jgi:hypothetical protein
MRGAARGAGGIVAVFAMVLAACAGGAFVLSEDDGGSSDAGGGSSGGGRGGSSGGGNGGSGSSGGGSGGNSSSGSGGSGSGSSSGSGGSSGGKDGGASGSCPPSPPPSGSPCPQVGFACEYGVSPSPLCDQLAQCSGSGWMYQGGASCPAGACPPSYGSVPLAGGCQPQGLVCGYAEGTCTCSNGGLLVRIDAGTGAMWRCFAQQAGCPSPRPRIGTPCAQAGQNCDYGACYGGVTLTCRGGTWQQAAVPCPAAATGP